MRRPPIPIALLCAFLFIWTARGLAGVLLAMGKAPIGMLLWALLMDVLQLASFVGLWLMRRWSVYLYLLTYLIGVGGAFLVGAPYQLTGWDIALMAGLPLVYLAVVLPYRKQLA